MPSLPPGKDWNYSFFTFFPHYRDGNHSNLIIFFLSSCILPIMLALPILLWPLHLWVDGDINDYHDENNNNMTNSNTSFTTTTTTTSIIITTNVSSNNNTDSVFNDNNSLFERQHSINYGNEGGRDERNATTKGMMTTIEGNDDGEQQEYFYGDDSENDLIMGERARTQSLIIAEASGESWVDELFMKVRALHTTKWAQIVMFILTQGCTFAVYQFCLWFTGTFFSNQPGKNSRGEGSSGNREIILFVVFSVVMEVFNTIVQIVSRFADLIKWRPGPSLEMLNSIQMSCFITTFSRSLFQHIGSWGTLIALLFIHLAQHFILYPLRLTEWYFNLSSKIQEKLLCVPLLGPAIYDESPLDVWRVRLNLDMATRYVATEASTIAYIITLVFLRYGWNSHYYAFFANDLPYDDFVRTVVFLSINVVVECVFLTLTHNYFVDLARPLGRLCYYNKWYFWSMVFGVGHVLTDVSLVRAVINFP